MRDLLIGALIFGSVPLCLFRPDYGILVYAWIGLMNPHRLSWRLAEAPVGLVIAAATLLGVVLKGAIRPIPMRITTALLLLWIGYTTVTTLNALSQEAWVEWNRFSRIIFMCFVAMMLLQDRKRLESFLWVCMASVGFFGVKGGIFSIVTGGHNRVWGPEGSFIEGNNELALAELMVLPLMLYFLHRSTKAWQKWAYYATSLLTCASILFSYSRGAFVAFAGLALVLMARSRYRVQAFLTAAVLGAVLIAFVPAEWKDRMISIESYRTDESAMGRINAWHFAYNVAKDRLFGGGFRTFTPELFLSYAPNPSDYHDAHSIYFEVLGEQGFPGLAIYLGILFASLWRLERLRKHGKNDPDRRWIVNLAEMLQYSLIAYMLGGCFLGLAYFDLYYYFVISALLLEFIAQREVVAARVRAKAAAASAELAPHAEPSPGY